MLNYSNPKTVLFHFFLESDEFQIMLIMIIFSFIKFVFWWLNQRLYGQIQLLYLKSDHTKELDRKTKNSNNQYSW